MIDQVSSWSLILLGAIIGGLTLYFRSYLARKAENLATKEDVQQLTRLTEEIRASVANLEWFQQEEVKAILNFFDAASRYILGPINRHWLVTGVQLQPSEILALLTKAEEDVHTTSSAFYRLLFYGTSNLLLVAAGDLANSCIRASEILGRHVPAIAKQKGAWLDAIAQVEASEPVRDGDPRATALMRLNERIHRMTSELTLEKTEASVAFGAFLQAVHAFLRTRGIDIEPLELDVLRGAPPRPSDEDEQNSTA